MRPKDITVFVSSTSRDLEDYRAVARNVLLDLHWRPEMMEHFGALPEPTVEACREGIERCDLVLLLVAWRQGWVPTAEQGGTGHDSVTSLELAHARAKRIPVLVLLASETWPGNQWEDDQVKRQWVSSFRESLNQPAAFFEYEPPTTREAERLPTFRAILKQNLLSFKERILARDDRDLGEPDFFRSARDGLMDGASIPVLGCGVYGDGPLSPQALVKSLAKTLVPGAANAAGGLSKERIPLATAAEYQERFDGSRDEFLKRFRRTLEQQSAEAPASPVLDLLTGLRKITLIVLATYDRLLEEKLERAGRQYVVVSHVLRSYEGRNDGNVLLLRPGRPAEFAPADMISFAPDDLIVYRPQGSPFLHDSLDPDLEIDTVVVTETDHAAFLQRLDNKRTGVPIPLRNRFRRSPLLFLGYTMDAWQYRLMMLIFQSEGRQARNASILAVRVPDPEIEEIAWNRLNTSLIRMDPNQFARSALAAQIGTE
jgi:hypothetical protein